LESVSRQFIADHSKTNRQRPFSFGANLVQRLQSANYFRKFLIERGGLL